MIYVFLFTLLIVIIFGLLLDFFIKYIKVHNSLALERIKSFESYLTILAYYMDKSYEIIHKEKILVFSIEGIRLSEIQYNEASKSYTSLVLKLLGPNLKDDMVVLFGDESTLIFNIMEFFNNKYEKDEVYKTASDNLMSGDNIVGNNVPKYNGTPQPNDQVQRINLTPDQSKLFGLSNGVV